MRARGEYAKLISRNGEHTWGTHSGGHMNRQANEWTSKENIVVVLITFIK